MLTRKLFRTAWSYKAQFISMILMITLGMGMFLGFNMEWKTIEVDTFKFFEETNYADYRLYSEKGFTADDLDKIEGIEGVDAATRYLSVNLDIKGEKNKSLALDVSENYTVSTFTVMDGEATPRWNSHPRLRLTTSRAFSVWAKTLGEHNRNIVLSRRLIWRGSFISIPASCNTRMRP